MSGPSLIRAAAFCPHPPLLVPQVGAGEPVAVRAPAVAAVRALLPAVEQVCVLGSGERAAGFPPGSRGSFAGYGVDVSTHLPGAASSVDATLPLSLAVGGWLLEAAGWTGPTVGVASGPAGDLDQPLDIDRPTGLLVMGDGSARRTEKAPGWLDDRAEGYDAAVAAALQAGDAEALRTDLALAEELLAAGAPAWTAASGLLAGRAWTAELNYDAAPYGVGYFVASWFAADSS